MLELSDSFGDGGTWKVVQESSPSQLNTEGREII